MYPLSPIFSFRKIKDHASHLKKQDCRLLLCKNRNTSQTENRNVTASELSVLSKVSDCIGGKWGNQADEQ